MPGGRGGGKSRAIHGARPAERLRPFKIVPGNFSEPSGVPIRPQRQQTKGPAFWRGLLFVGGGGGNRTPVRRRSAPGATCLAQRSVSFRGSTLGKAHRETSRFCFSRQPTGGNRQRSRGDDPTPTSTGTSGFGARP